MKQILCFGDSNTYGLIPKTTERYKWNIRWTGQLSNKLENKGYRIVEEGLCGRTTIFEDPLREGRRGTALLPTLLETHRPIERVILMLGTNDCKTVYDAAPEVIGRGVEKLIHQIRRENVNIKILLISPILLGENVGAVDYDPEFNEESVLKSKRLKTVYEKIAKEYGCDFMAASDYAKPSEVDREHMDEEGHTVLAEAVYKKIKEEF